MLKRTTLVVLMTSCLVALLSCTNSTGTEDNKSAIQKLTKLANEGDVDAQTKLGIMYKRGDGVKADYMSSVNLLEKSASHGDTTAMAELSQMYAHGWGVEKNPSKATELLNKSSELGNARAKARLAIHLLIPANKYVASKDSIDNSIALLKESESKGDNLGTAYLGIIYSGLYNDRTDCAESERLIKKAADRNYAFAQMLYGVMLYDGLCKTKDYKEAYFWFTKAAMNNDDTAQQFLGKMFMNGQGMPKNYKNAYFWLSISAAQGNTDSATLRDAIESKLSQAELCEVQNNASNWAPTGVGAY